MNTTIKKAKSNIHSMVNFPLLCKEIYLYLRLFVTTSQEQLTGNFVDLKTEGLETVCSWRLE